jgi:hypothetical protein
MSYINYVIETSQANWEITQHNLCAKYMSELIDEHNIIINDKSVDVNQHINIIINMSKQSDGFIDFMNEVDCTSTSTNISTTSNVNGVNGVTGVTGVAGVNGVIGKIANIYLHCVNDTKFLVGPILLTEANKDKIATIIANIGFDGHTLYDNLIKWINDNNITNVKIYD